MLAPPEHICFLCGVRYIRRRGKGVITRRYPIEGSDVSNYSFPHVMDQSHAYGSRQRLLIDLDM